MFFKTQSEFSVQSTTKNILTDNHGIVKLFTDQSEVSAIPAGCAKKCVNTIQLLCYCVVDLYSVLML